jgi:hypothetical protein
MPFGSPQKGTRLTPHFGRDMLLWLPAPDKDACATSDMENLNLVVQYTDVDNILHLLSIQNAP